MTALRHSRPAFGKPGIAPRWTRGAKDAVGTAYSASSRVWFTSSAGIVTEIYHPTIDKPQVRDLQYLVTDGESFFHDERRHLTSTIEWLDPHSLGLRIKNVDPQGRYEIVKEIVTDPHQSCLLVETVVRIRKDLRGRLRLFALLAPHLGGAGFRNTANVADIGGRALLTAHSEESGTWLAMDVSRPFLRLSCGYVGASDGWTDLSQNRKLDWEFDSARDGNVALTGEIDFEDGRPFTLGVAFGESLESAVTTLSQSLGFPFERHRERFTMQWSRACERVVPLAPLKKASGDGGALYHASHRVLLAHEDKTFPGAMIASLSIPWGETKSDDDLGGYHLVWTRDMVQTATGLLASGHRETPLRSLIYLACTQRPDGGFAQNFWLDGAPYWQGVQLDEVAFPILLARRLHDAKALEDFDPYPMVRAAAGYLVREGPATPQERWEENGGYSPSTLASNVAALVCAAAFAGERGDEAAARFLREYADFLVCHLEAWTVTRNGTLHPDVKRHFIRINPVEGISPFGEDPDTRTLTVRNRPPGSRVDFPAKDIVDAGFLELVRYGIRKPGDSLVEDSLAVVDRVLRASTPFGPSFRRYNHDGYGQRDDGGPFEGWGRGRAWPLLTGERGHYEMAAGRKVEPYLHAMEGFASATGLLPEQIWDEADRPGSRLYLGRPTGSAMPLAWAHAEYVKLLRSRRDGRVFDLVPEVTARYCGPSSPDRLEVWKRNRRPASVPAGWRLRVMATEAFNLRYTANEWQNSDDARSDPTSLGVHFVDVSVPPQQAAPIEFTFRWLLRDEWEGKNHRVNVERSKGGKTS
ncbi:MAG TPA: glycoside hydrolase family 15 protein [Vicinamibacteria bacterium]|nr:glycoside hydrolase family 15 protein [Vicinamibacteria bacterium]